MEGQSEVPQENTSQEERITTETPTAPQHASACEKEEVPFSKIGVRPPKAPDKSPSVILSPDSGSAVETQPLDVNNVEMEEPVGQKPGDQESTSEGTSEDQSPLERNEQPETEGQRAEHTAENIEEEKVDRRPLALDRPILLEAQGHKFVMLQTDFPVGTTVDIKNNREGASYGVVDFISVVQADGRVQAIFSNCCRRDIVIAQGELKQVTIEVCKIESEWFKDMREKEDLAYCSTCGEQGPIAKIDGEEIRCESCEAARKGETRDPPLWPPTPAPAQTDEEFLALFELGPDTYGVQEELKKVLLKHKDAFVHGDLDLGHTKVLECEIDTGDHPPINCPPYKVPFAQRPALEEALRDMLLRKVIAPTDSPWAFPLVIVPKKGPDGEFTSIRVCADLRKLNAITQKKSFHFTTLEEIFEALGASGGEEIFMHTCDFQTGFWQIGMSADAALKCSIATPFGHFSFLRMPFGYIHAPLYFCKLMAIVLKDLLGKHVQIFVDDCLVWHFTPIGSIEILDKVLERVKGAGLRLNPAKCKFLRTEVPFLGHTISKNGLQPNSQKVDALRALKPMNTLKGVRSISGAFNFYRKFVKNYAVIMGPIHKLLKGGGKSNRSVIWTDEALVALEQIKEAMTTAPVLKFPQRGRRFHLKVDTSALGIGAVLEQTWPTGRHPVAFFSLGLRGARQKYPSYQLECVGIVEALRHFHNYLFGVDFDLETDCISLLWLLRLKEPKALCARMIMEVMQYKCKVIHTSGASISLADLMSRQEPDEQRTEQENTEINIILCDLLQELQERPPEKTVEVNTIICSMESVQGAEDREISLSRLLKAQQDDPTMAPIHELLKEEFDEMIAGYVYDEQGILCKNTEKGVVIWMPEALVQDCLYNQHMTLTGGHLGTRKTVEALKRRFWWKGLGVDTAKFIKQCLSCLTRKGRVDPRPAARVTKPPLKVMQRVYIDIVGPLSETPSGNKWVVTFMEGVTRWMEAAPLSEATALAVAKALTEQVICRWGVFSELVSDNGRCFTAQLCKEVCKLLGVRQIFISPYHPQGNCIEPAHKGLVDYISQFLDGRESWEDVLPFALYCTRANFHTTTQATPSLLMTGRELALPSDIVLGPKLAKDNLPVTGQEYVRELQKRLKRVREEARNNDCAVRANTAKKLNARAQREKPIRVGDIVYIKVMHKKGKFGPRLKGPYKVLKERSDVTFDLLPINGPAEVFMWHRVHMRGYLVHQDDADYENDDWLEAMREESEIECAGEMKLSAEGRNEELQRDAAYGGGTAAAEDIQTKCAETVCSDHASENTKRGGQTKANSARSAPADFPPDPLCTHDSDAPVCTHEKQSRASAPTRVAPLPAPRKRGRPPKGDAPKKGCADGAPNAPEPLPRKGRTTQTSSVFPLLPQEAAKELAPGEESEPESGTQKQGAAEEKKGEGPIPRPRAPDRSHYNLRSGGKEP